MTTSWHTGICEKIRDAIRLGLFVALAIDAAFACIFSVVFCYKFFVFSWQWCLEHLFAEPW
jgi:hypothetical protein